MNIEKYQTLVWRNVNCNELYLVFEGYLLKKNIMTHGHVHFIVFRR